VCAGTVKSPQRNLVRERWLIHHVRMKSTADAVRQDIQFVSRSQRPENSVAHRLPCHQGPYPVSLLPAARTILRLDGWAHHVSDRRRHSER